MIFPMVQSPMRNSCGTKKIIPKLNIIVVIIGFSCLKRQALSVAGAPKRRPEESYLHNTSEV
jgi:hypothetical protein